MELEARTIDDTHHEKFANSEFIEIKGVLFQVDQVDGHEKFIRLRPALPVHVVEYKKTSGFKSKSDDGKALKDSEAKVGFLLKEVEDKNKTIEIYKASLARAEDKLAASLKKRNE